MYSDLSDQKNHRPPNSKSCPLHLNSTEHENPILYCDDSEKPFQEILTELVLQTYDISTEKDWLVDDYSKFEYYRGSYPVRREFSAYMVEASDFSEDNRRKLRRLGFNLIN